MLLIFFTVLYDVITALTGCEYALSRTSSFVLGTLCALTVLVDPKGFEPLTCGL